MATLTPLTQQYNSTTGLTAATGGRAGVFTPVAAAKKPTTTTKGPTKYQPFTTLMPFDKVFNPALITGLAESQINPEIARARGMDMNSLQKTAAATGSYRSGFLPTQGNRISDMYERQRKEQVEQFTGTIKDLANNWYTDQMEAYGKNPSKYVMPTLPSWDDFMKQNPGYNNTYNNVIANQPTTYTSPFS